MAEDSNTDVFVYTAGAVVPEDVVRVRVHPSVRVISNSAFARRQKLEEVELCDGLLGIGKSAFYSCTNIKQVKIPSTVAIIRECAFENCENLEEIELCDGLQTIEQYAFLNCNVLKRLMIPNTVRSIGDLAFCHTYNLQYLQLPEGIERMGVYTFSHNRCTTCRIPPSLTTISGKSIGNSKSIFSVEFSEGITLIKNSALYESYSLRNVAFPPNAEVQNAFHKCPDLQQLCETDQQIINALKHRFDNLPIHKMIYYQSYNSVTVDQLNNATSIRISQRRSKPDPTCSQQDCLGMTPLHIMACSTVQNVQLYRLLVDKYPENLITKDRWGAVPLLYAVWGNAPTEIVDFLVESYKSIHPNHELNWTQMVTTIGRVSVLTTVRNLLNVQQESFPGQTIDWNQVINELTKPKFMFLSEDHVSEEVFRYLVKYRMAERISALGPRKWREDMACKLEGSFSFYRGSDDISTPKGWYIFVSSKLCEYEKAYINLKEATALLELTLWKNQIAENFRVNGHSNKRAKIDEADLRKQCRVNCGANIIIEHVLSFLTG